MAKIITVDQKACTGCRQCELVCSVKHTGSADPTRARISVMKWEAEGFYLPMLCQQCMEPACAAVCPKDAISRREGPDGAEWLRIDRDLCIGCKMCVMACPFGAMTIDEKLSKVIKCDLCHGEATCVTFCEAGALKFVDASTATLPKKRSCAARFSALMGVH